ncbi:MAG: DUF2066 domain-containing protein [Alphaproteobacteria bacterium]|nr:DUF2066 domain-containing protein [Alphaproteobacteria bacterium]MDE2494863.1 DUF2066 domain-containing protein [Alphaproteobacteria bacterium]
MRRLHSLLALAFALAFVCLLVRPAAADGLFTVSNIHVDASAASVVEARDAAIAGGRPAAWQILYRRLTRQQDWARQPVLDDSQLQRLITTYFPANERRSTTRYVADMTYVFNPDAVARALQGAGIPYAAVAAKRILVVPMSPGYSRSSGWTVALASPRFAGSVVPFSVPIGDAQDASALGGLSFDTATWTDIEPTASRIHATEAVLIQAAVTGNRMTITLRRLGVGELPTKISLDVPLLQNPGATYPSAADAAVRAIDDMWKSHAAVDFSQKGTLTADVRVASLAQFAGMQNALASVPNISGVSVDAVDIGQARLSVSYIGTVDQLRAALAQAGIGLVSHGKTWQLTQGTGGNAGTP